jgi:hypothetical protein
MILLNLILGTLVITVGFWILWSTASQVVLAGWMLAAGGLLWWKARSVTEVWAWATLVLGAESFAWPLQRMIELKSAADAPSHDEMGAILSAVILGLFSSVFWISFSYGLFKRAWGTPAGTTSDALPTEKAFRPAKRKKVR